MIDLARITKLVDLMREQEARTVALETELAAAKAALYRTQCEDLPELMTEIGLSEVKLLDGSKLSVSAEVQAGVSADRMPGAVAWLKEHGYDGIVKTEVSVAFGRGEATLAQQVQDLLCENVPGHDPLLRQTINTQTLQAFIKERMREGVTVPADLFAVRPYNKAKLKAPKA